MDKLKNRIHSILNVIANAMSIFNNTPHSALKRHSLPQGAREERSVAFSNKVMETRDWYSLRSVPPKYDIDSSVQYGRSMIEMLGVLAIIAVLSVGGIAGYSKAMEKYKVNKIVADYNMLIMGLLEHRENIINSIKGQSGEIYLNNLIVAAEIAPKAWTLNGRYLDDGYGNLVYPYATNEIRTQVDFPRIVLDFNLNGLSTNENGSIVSANFSDKLCMEIFNNLVVPLHSVLIRGYVYPYSDMMRYGDKYCGGNLKCIKDLSLSDIHNICNVCDRANKRCNITIGF